MRMNHSEMLFAMATVGLGVGLGIGMAAKYGFKGFFAGFAIACVFMFTILALVRHFPARGRNQKH